MHTDTKTRKRQNNKNSDKHPAKRQPNPKRMDQAMMCAPPSI